MVKNVRFISQVHRGGGGGREGGGRGGSNVKGAGIPLGKYELNPPRDISLGVAQAFLARKRCQQGIMT